MRGGRTRIIAVANALAIGAIAALCAIAAPGGRVRIKGFPSTIPSESSPGIGIVLSHVAANSTTQNHRPVDAL